MDLALTFGTSVAALSRDMTERELGLWALYANRKGLPFRRLELMLAQLTLWTTRVWGSDKFKLGDFLLDDHRPKQVEPQPSVATVIGAIGGVRVYKLGQRSKRG